MSTDTHKRNSLRRRVLLAVPAAVLATAIGAPFAAATPAPSGSAPTATPQQIIMRDGGICDPIRHMGC